MEKIISVDEETCVGCGACTTCDNFEMKDNGKAEPINNKADENPCNEEAVEICPVQAIKITEE